MNIIEIPEELKELYREAITRAKEDRPRYLDWIRNEIDIAIALLNKFDKIYVLGGLGSRLIKSSATFYNQFLKGQEGPDKDKVKNDLRQDDEDIETLLEYAMNMATATPNGAINVLPTQDDIEAIYQQLSKIRTNVAFLELSADVPQNANEFDQWLRLNVMLQSTNVRGDGYHSHIEEVFKEVFLPHNDFLRQYYGFDANDIQATVVRFDTLVYSKVVNPYGVLMAHSRFKKWMEETGEETVLEEDKKGKHFIRQFTEANPDLYNEEEPTKIIIYNLDDVQSYNKLYWIIPRAGKDELIFEKLSSGFGDNSVFFEPPKFKAFPLNDTLLKLKPLVKDGGKHYQFSVYLSFRNIFEITEHLIQAADEVYYENYFKGNSHLSTKDNYIERKTIQLFRKLLPSATFYHSLKYKITEDGMEKEPELDILGISDDAVYIVEVKAGRLSPKHRRGALMGLKDRLKETINEGSYQCHRALKYIQNNNNAIFEYVEAGHRKTVVVDKAHFKSYYKISVTLEHFSSISANLRYLVESGMLSPDFMWTWVVSLYDMMVFADLIENEADFREYLSYRMSLYDRKDVEFYDEIDILGFYFDGKFPLHAEREKEILLISNYKDDIENYYTKTGVGISEAEKPKKKR